MKKPICAYFAALAAAGLLLLGGCVDSTPVSGTDAGTAPPPAVVTSSPASASDTAGQPQPSALSAVNTRKLMQVNFDKVYKVNTVRLDKYANGMEGSERSLTRGASVPELLSADIAEALGSGSAEHYVTDRETGVELTKEQFLEKTGADASEYEYSAVAASAVDIDNDGVTDIVVFEDLGGTGGFCEIQIFRGGADGYAKTDEWSTIRYPISCVSFDGKNYLCQENYDYDTKYFSGYLLCCVSDGRFADMVNVRRDISDYSVSIPFEDSGFGGIDQVRATLVNKNMPKILEANDGVIYGTAEEVIDKYTRFRSDIDNDGSAETYDKYMWYPSNMGTVKTCMWNWLDGSGEYIEPETDPIKNIIEADPDIAEMLYTFWLDPVDGKNVLYLYTDQDDSFILSAYIVEK